MGVYRCAGSPAQSLFVKEKAVPGFTGTALFLLNLCYFTRVYSSPNATAQVVWSYLTL